MHIGIVIWALFVSRGGLERFGVNLAEEMVRRGHRVTIFHAEKKDTQQQSPYPISNSIQLIELPKDRRKRDTITKTRAIIVDSAIDVLAALFSWDELLRFPAVLQGTSIPLLVSEHSTPQAIEQELWNQAEHRACLEAADRIHILLPSFLTGYPTYLHNRISVIPNPVTPPSSSTSERRPQTGRKTIVAAGRFDDAVKQFSLLIGAFAFLAQSFPEWDLILCGDGPDRERYLDLINKLKLNDRILIPGMVHDLSDFFQKGHIFCIPSRYEGFGLVTVEAQSYGLPTVGFAECSGTNTIIQHNENGLLAEKMNEKSLAEILETLMSDASLRLQMGKQGIAMLERYNAKMVYDLWENLLQDTVKVSSPRLCSLASHNHSYSSDPSEKEAQLALKEILMRKTPFTRKRKLSDHIGRFFRRTIIRKVLRR